MTEKKTVRLKRGDRVAAKDVRALSRVAKVTLVGKPAKRRRPPDGAKLAWSLLDLTLKLARRAPPPTGKEADYVRVHELVASVVAPSPWWDREPWSALMPRGRTRIVAWLLRELRRVDETFGALPPAWLSDLLSRPLARGKSHPRGSLTIAGMAAEAIVEARALGACVIGDGRDKAVERVRKSVEKAARKHPVRETT